MIATQTFDAPRRERRQLATYACIVVLSLLSALLLSACAPIPKMHDPAARFGAERVGLSEELKTLAPSGDWWLQFKDADLDALMARALADAPSLAAARARIGRAAAAAEAAGAADKPVIGLGFDATRQRFTEHGLVPPPIAGTMRTTATLQAGISYEWDFFGRNRAALAAAVGQQQASEAEAAAARLALSAQVGRAWVALARVLEQRALLDEQLAQREQALTLVRQRVGAGLDTEQELRGAETPLPELRRQGLQLGEQAQLLRHQLASLSAQPVDALARLAPRMPEALALDGGAGLGVDLLGRRPEIVAARWRIDAAGEQVKVARAQFYPNMSLTAFAGFSSIGLDQLLKSGSQQFGFGPAIRLPLFDTGRLRAQLKGSVADVDAAVAAYNGAVLEAVRDASDQLATQRSLQRQAVEQRALLANAERQLELARTRFDAGLGGKLAVLNARLAQLNQQQRALELRGQTLDSQIGLMRALGGGWAEAAANTAAQ